MIPSLGDQPPLKYGMAKKEESIMIILISRLNIRKEAQP
jgi:hypothetical protein